MVYSLNITLTAEQVDLLHKTNSKIAISKPVQNGNPDFAWLQFSPFQENQVVWEDKYWFYASNEIDNGIIISKIYTQTKENVIPDKLYELENGTINGPKDGGTPGQFSLQNKYEGNPYMTIGLVQAAKLNGQDEEEPMSANEVLYQSTISEMPVNTLYIWVQSNLKSKAAANNNITSPKTKVIFTPSVNLISVKYNSATGGFDIQ